MFGTKKTVSGALGTFNKAKEDLIAAVAAENELASKELNTLQVERDKFAAREKELLEAAAIHDNEAVRGQRVLAKLENLLS